VAARIAIDRHRVGQLWLTAMDMVDLARVVGTRGDDPLEALRALQQLRLELARAETVLVHRARTTGLTGVQIAEALGVSKQAVHKKHGGRRFDGAS
jgi:DNA-directed RNA polymerase specialized sigma24 family protein